jgi:hypothetical protein
MLLDAGGMQALVAFFYISSKLHTRTRRAVECSCAKLAWRKLGWLFRQWSSLSNDISALETSFS